MIFWVVAAVLTAAVAAAILFPLSRSGKERGSFAAHDASVYRDQLAEIDRDVTSGSIEAKEAEAARAEVARRLIKAQREADVEGGPIASRLSFRRPAAVLVVVIIPLIGLGGYLALGRPGMPSAPLAEREAGPGGDPQLADLVRKAESHLRSDPDDGQGWDVLAPIYFRTGRIQDAGIAYGNAIRLLGATAEREAGLGESLVMEQGGQVPEAARDAFQRALKLDPANPKAQFFLAVALAQSGKKDEALAAFGKLERESPPDAPWLPVLRSQIAALGGSPASPPQATAGANEAQPAPPGNPTPEQMAAAGKMSDKDRTAMISGMVSRMDAQLSRQPNDLAGWKRLVRSYMVLGDPAKAKAALSRALKTFPAGTDDGRDLIALARTLGVDTAEATQ